MALWVDPFEELIGELERTLPDPKPSAGNFLPLEELQRITDVILYGTEGEREALEHDPMFLRLGHRRVDESATRKR